MKNNTMLHTGDDAQNKAGHYECCSCNKVITMLGNYKDKMPPCPWEKTGVFYKKVSMTDFYENTKKRDCK